VAGRVRAHLGRQAPPGSTIEREFRDFLGCGDLRALAEEAAEIGVADVAATAAVVVVEEEVRTLVAAIHLASRLLFLGSSRRHLSIL
jgi:hypothetical protein